MNYVIDRWTEDIGRCKTCGRLLDEEGRTYPEFCSEICHDIHARQLPPSSE